MTADEAYDRLGLSRGLTMRDEILRLLEIRIAEGEKERGKKNTKGASRLATPKKKKRKLSTDA